MHLISNDYRNIIEYATCVVLPAIAAKRLMPYPPHASAIKSCDSERFCKVGDTLRDLVPFGQFKKREKHPWRSVNFRLKLTLLHGCSSRFLNCANGTKSPNAPHRCSKYKP